MSNRLKATLFIVAVATLLLAQQPLPSPTPGGGGGGGGSAPANTVPNGLTGATTFQNHGVVIGQLTNPLVSTGPGTAGQVLTSNGSVADPTFQTLSGGGMTDPTTTKGDLIARGAAAPAGRLGIGSDGQVLTADAASASGMKWGTPAGGSVNVMTPSAKGFEDFCISSLTVLIGGTAGQSNALDPLWPCGKKLTQATAGQSGTISRVGPIISASVGGWELTGIVRTGSTITTENLSFGLVVSTGGISLPCTLNSSGGSCVVLIHDTNLGPNWRLKSCNAGACANVDTGVVVAVDTDYRLRLRAAAPGTLFGSVNGSAEVAIPSSANVPSLSLVAGIGIEVLASVTRFASIYWMGWDMTAAGRVFP